MRDRLFCVGLSPDFVKTHGYQHATAEASLGLFAREVLPELRSW